MLLDIAADLKLKRKTKNRGAIETSSGGNCKLLLREGVEKMLSNVFREKHIAEIVPWWTCIPVVQVTQGETESVCN